MTQTPNAARASVATGTCRVCRTPHLRLSAEDGRVLSHPSPIGPDVECDGTSRLPLGATA